MLSSQLSRGVRTLKVQKKTYSTAEATPKGPDSSIKRRLLSIHPESLYKSIRTTSRLREESKIRPAIHDWLCGTKVSEMMRDWQGYHRYGLKHDDLWVEFPYVQEACVRLPKSELIARTNRIREALVANSQNRQLPEEQWTKMEEDTPYLHPYISEVQKEWADRKAFRSRIPDSLGALFSTFKLK